MKNKKILVALLSFGAASACLAGGTYAWYVINATASITVTGQTAVVPEGLTLRTSVDDGASFDDVTNNRATIIPSNNVLAPVTSGEFADGDELVLKTAPTYEVAYDTTEADENTYTTFQLEFTSDSDNEGTEIYLDKEMIEYTFSGQTSAAWNSLLLGSLRFGFEDITDGTVSRSYIFNPQSALNEDVLTTVAGVADLNGDGVFDYMMDEDDADLTNYEVLYGYDNSSNDIAYMTPADTDRANPVPNSNTIWWDASHVAGGYYDYPLEAVDIQTMEDNELLPIQTAHGAAFFDHALKDLDNLDAPDDLSHPIAILDNTGTAVVKVTIWLEGWDHDCVNDIASLSNEVRSITSTLGFIAPSLA